METNFFWHLFQELGPELVGKRLEKIYEPSPGVLNLKFGSSRFLLVLPSRKRGAVFVTSSKPDNPQTPSARVQWLRKRLKNRKIVDYRVCRTARKAVLGLTPGPGKWMMIDLQEGIDLIEDLHPDFDQEPAWPKLEEVLSNEEIYRQYPQLTPPLRKTLKSLPVQNAQHLLSELRRNVAEEFSVCWKQGQVWSVLPWRPPETLPGLEKTKIFSRALDAAECYGWSLLEEKVDPQGDEDRLRRKALKRIEKNLQRLENDEQRLRALCAEQDQAELLKSHLYALDRNAKTSGVDIRTQEGGLHHLPLNPEYTLLENMELMYKRSQKGRRGLKRITKRREYLLQELAALTNREIDPLAWIPQGRREKKDPQTEAAQLYRGIPLHVFESSEGFRILQGKNQKANHRLLTQVAKPYDYWFHAENGPGAHVVLQRDSQRQQVSRQALQEAAVVAGSAGYQAREEKARVVCALVKDVHTVKGAPLGKVRVERVKESLLVELHTGVLNGLRKIQ